MKAQASMEAMISVIAIVSFTAALWGAQLDWKEKSDRWSYSMQAKSNATLCAVAADDFLNNSQSEFDTAMDCNQLDSALHENIRVQKKGNRFLADDNGLNHYEP